MVLQAMSNSVLPEEKQTSAIPEATVNMAVAYMRHMLKGKLILLSELSESSAPNRSMTQLILGSSF